MSRLYRIVLTKTDRMNVESENTDVPRALAQQWVDEAAAMHHHGEEVSARVAIVENGKEIFVGDEIRATQNAK